MNEARRAEYLEAIGIVQYVSRRQLPGAAASRPLEIVPVAPAITPVTPAPGPRRPADFELPVRPAEKPVQEPAASVSGPVPRFTLAVIVAGSWLWVEDLADRPLASEQVALVGAMARALLLRQGQFRAQAADSHPGPRKPLVEQFRWPLHNNRQLDLDADAARAGVEAFISRKLEEYECTGMILLGQGSADWVTAPASAVASVCTHSTVDMLQNPGCKRSVWKDLLTLVSAN